MRRARTLALAAVLLQACRAAPGPAASPQPARETTDLLASPERSALRADAWSLSALAPALAFDVGGWEAIAGPVPAFRSRRVRQSLSFDFATTGEKKLGLVMRAGGASDRSLSVRVSLNGHSLGNLDVPGEDAELLCSIPAATQKSGRNVLELALREPKAGQRRAPRHFVLSGIDVRPVGSSLRSGPGEGAWLPPGGELSFFVVAAEGGRLELQAYGLGGRVGLRAGLDHGQGERPLEALTAEKGERVRREIALRGPPGRPFRLILTETAGSGLRIERLQLTEKRSLPPSPSRLPARPDVVVFLVDTLRADALGAYDAPLPTRHFDAFARESVLFTDAIAQSSWTLPSVAALFTGLDPDRLGVYGPWGDLPESVETLAEALGRAGYRTGGFVANALMTRRRGYAQGFAEWRQEEKPSSTGRPAGQIVAEALTWLEGAAAPRFAYLHVMEPHAPYGPRGGELVDLARKVSPNAAEIERLRAGYRSDVLAADEALGALLDGLRRRGRLDQSIVIALADHGEEFFEHRNQGHGKTLYREVLHIPFAVRLPGGRRGATRDAAQVQHADLLPTLLSLLGEPTAGVDGRDLSSLWLEGRPPVRSALASRLLFERRSYDKAAARWGSLELIVNEEADAPHPLEMYDLHADPGETRDVLSANPVVAGFLLGELRARRRAAMAAGGAEKRSESVTDADALERLRALGYVQ